MTMRSSRTVTFEKPFVLGPLKQTFPPGDYRVETGEELQEGISFPIFKRRRTVIYLHQEQVNPEHSRVMVIDPGELEDALRNDHALRNMTSASRASTLDHKAIDRAEDEGMTVQYPRQNAAASD